MEVARPVPQGVGGSAQGVKDPRPPSIEIRERRGKAAVVWQKIGKWRSWRRLGSAYIRGAEGDAGGPGHRRARAPGG